MKLSDTARATCLKIVEQFKTGNLPKALTPIFVNRKNNIPSSSWSFNNRLIMYLYNTSDARTYKQWKEVGRSVRKKNFPAEKISFNILGPSLVKIKDKETEKIRQVLVGFHSIPEFKFEDTLIIDQEKWDKCCKPDMEENDRLKNLPLREVADEWNLKVESFNGKEGSALGYYQPNKRIAIGVKNLSTWTHELIHAADQRNGTINKLHGQQQDNEVVAEVGGAVLLMLLDEPVEADLGGAWEYILHYSKSPENTIKICLDLTKRICECVELILSTSDKYLT